MFIFRTNLSINITGTSLKLWIRKRVLYLLLYLLSSIAIGLEIKLRILFKLAKTI